MYECAVASIFKFTYISTVSSTRIWQSRSCNYLRLYIGLFVHTYNYIDIYMYVIVSVTVNIFMKSFMAAAAADTAAAIAELRMSKNSEGHKTFNSARILICAYLSMFACVCVHESCFPAFCWRCRFYRCTCAHVCLLLFSHAHPQIQMNTFRCCAAATSTRRHRCRFAHTVAAGLLFSFTFRFSSFGVFTGPNGRTLSKAQYS